VAKISEIMSKGKTLSFEFFPPKTPEAMTGFNSAVDALAALDPDFVSITYGAGGSARDTTYDLVLQVDSRQKFPAMPHLTCVGHTRAELVDLLASYRANGIDNVLALAGDPPSDGSDSGGDFVYATELVELVREVGDFSIGVAAFPEVHPRSTDRSSDRKHLAAKLALADFGMTQFFFDVSHYKRLVEELSDLGCSVPLLPGVMPFVSVAGTRRMAKMNNTEIPAALQHQLDLVDGDGVATRELGVQVATELVGELLEFGVPGVHLYAMNRAESIQAIYKNLGLGTN